MKIRILYNEFGSDPVASIVFLASASTGNLVAEKWYGFRICLDKLTLNKSLSGLQQVDQA